MEKFKVLTPEIEEIDQAITALKVRRQKLVDKEVKKKANALCAEIAARKARR